MKEHRKHVHFCSFAHWLICSLIQARLWHTFYVMMRKPSIMKKMYFSLLVVLLGVFAYAQESETKKIDININKDSGGDWYTAPWVWVVGAAVFILLLVALTRGGRRAD